MWCYRIMFGIKWASKRRKKLVLEIIRKIENKKFVENYKMRWVGGTTVDCECGENCRI